MSTGFALSLPLAHMISEKSLTCWILNSFRINKDWFVSLSLFIVTLLSRIPFRVSFLYSWDSVLYTRAIEHFDVSVHQPQPPGYIFYVGLVWLVNRLFGDPDSAMIWISAFAAAAAVAALYWLGKIMFNRATGLLASLLLATSLSFWGLSEVAFPYTLLAFLGTLLAIAIYKIWQGDKRYVLPSAALLGLSAGFRQDLLPFLLPLFLASLPGKGWRRAAGSALLLVVAIATWYLPSAILTGGFSVYREASSREMAGVLQDFSVFGQGPGALVRNASLFRHFMLLATAGALPFIAYFLLRLRAPASRSIRRDRRLLFLAVWFAPAALFYLFIHIGEPGYVFSILPASLLAASWGISLLATDLRSVSLRKVGKQLSYLLPALAIGANLFLFLASDARFSSRDLAGGDEVFQSRLDTMRANFKPKATLIVTVYEFERVLYYLPDYQVWHFDPVAVKNPETVVPKDVANVVFFGNTLELKDASLAESLPISDGKKLVYFNMEDAGIGKHVLAVDWNKKSVALS